MGRLILIAALGKNGELGKNNDLIWHIKEDMKFFKEKTINHHVLMGKNTFLSLPSMLKNRTHIVLTTNKDVTYENVMYIALKANTNVQPDTTPSTWQVFMKFPKARVIVSETEPTDEQLEVGGQWWKILSIEV